MAFFSFINISLATKLLSTKRKNTEQEIDIIIFLDETTTTCRRLEFLKFLVASGKLFFKMNPFQSNISKFSNVSHRIFPFHFIVLQQLPEFSVNGPYLRNSRFLFFFRKLSLFQNFRFWLDLICLYFLFIVYR